MAAPKMFSNSFILRGFSYQCSRNSFHSFSHRSAAPISRCFSSASRRAAPKSVPKRTPPPPIPASRSKTIDPNAETLKFAGRRAQGFGKLERKVAKEGSVVLFKAPSQRSYIIGAYGIATFCFAYAVYNSNVTFRDPTIPLPLWQQSLFGGVCVLMSVMGTVFLFKTSRLIRTVTAVNSNGKTYVRFSVRSMIPFRKPFEFDVLPRQIVFSRQLVVTPEAMSPQAAEKASRKQAVSEMSFFKAPLKKLSFGFWRIFRSVRQLFTQEGIIFVEVEGRKGDLRMDLNGVISQDLFLVGNPIHVNRS